MSDQPVTESPLLHPCEAEDIDYPPAGLYGRARCRVCGRVWVYRLDGDGRGEITPVPLVRRKPR